MIVVDRGRQDSFARLSGDFSPLHVDDAHARRSQFGNRVVHGVHLVLLALEQLAEPGAWRIDTLDAQFRSAVLVDEPIEFLTETLASGERRVTVRVGGVARSTVVVRLVPGRTDPTVPAAPTIGDTTAATLSFAEAAAVSGRTWSGFDHELARRMFPGLASCSAVDLGAILAATRVVGMRCPGERALFRRLRWERADPVPHVVDGAAGDEVEFHVATADPRFALLTIAIATADLRLTAEVIVREPPPAQPSLADVRLVVDPGSFAGWRAVVVGGSRGLGELAAKVLVAGGADVVVTFRSGSVEADAVVAELGPAASAVQYDALAPTEAGRAALIAGAPTHLLHFASPSIPKRPAGSWDPALFADFVGVYVTGLSELLSLFDSSGALQGVLYPSSTYVDERPGGFAEYAAAKAMAEELGAAWSRLRPGQRVVTPRFPPLVTDQTAARLGSDTSGNIGVVADAVKSLLD